MTASKTSSKKPEQPAGYEDPLQELRALTANLKDHLRRLEGQGVWAVPKGGDPPALNPIPETTETTETTETQGQFSGKKDSPPHVDSTPSSPKPSTHPPISKESGSRDVTSELKDIQITGLPGLMRVQALLGPCARCPLHKNRKHLVFGAGNPDADVVFIGEAPGFDEDRTGVPFVGKAGKLFEKMLKAMGLERDDIYIANILKCRPPRNRDPLPEEVQQCEPFLLAQLRCLNPSIIVTLGRIAAQVLLRTTTPISVLRGQFRDYLGWKLMPTFHPAYLLRNESKKRPTWEDLQAVMAEMDRLELKRKR